jgi:hypothetical protein
VFPDFKDSMTQAPLEKIGWRCRDYQAYLLSLLTPQLCCLQLDAGTSIAVVQRYLGHKNVEQQRCMPRFPCTEACFGWLHYVEKVTFWQ